MREPSKVRTSRMRRGANKEDWSLLPETELCRVEMGAQPPKFSRTVSHLAAAQHLDKWCGALQQSPQTDRWS